MQIVTCHFSVCSPKVCAVMFSRSSSTPDTTIQQETLLKGALPCFLPLATRPEPHTVSRAFLALKGCPNGGIKPSPLSLSDSKGDHVSFFFINAQRYSRFLCPTPIPFPSLLPLSPHYSLCSRNELRTMDIRVKMRFTVNFQRCLQDSLLDSRQHSASPL